jgi:hypothetical protein
MKMLASIIENRRTDIHILANSFKKIYIVHYVGPKKCPGLLQCTTET